MYRQRIHLKATTMGAWNEILEVAAEVNEIAGKRGWAQGTMWTQTIGPFGEVVIELDYPDLATFERETQAFFADPEIMGVLQRLDGKTVEGTGHSELWQRAEPVRM